MATGPADGTGTTIGTGGDVHLWRNGMTLDFNGQPYRTYRWLEDAPLIVQANLQPCYGPDRPETTIHRLRVVTPDGTEIVVDEKGLTRIRTASGYQFDIWRQLPTSGLLTGHRYLDVYLTESPTRFKDAKGVLPEYQAGEDPAKYLA